MSFELQFVGGAGSVTGSKYLLTYKSKRILVDCGLFQGLKKLRLQNWDGFPVDPATVDCIILTHAHIDHSGFIPRLIKRGFRGKIFATAATIDLCKVLLPDAGHLMEEEAAYLNRKNKTKHHPALPLFTQNEAENSLQNFEPVEFNKSLSIDPEVSFEFRYAGHILGASSVILTLGQTKIAFTGDIGRLNDAIMYPPQKLSTVDYLITESTYGNRLHTPVNILDQLERIINQTVQRRGVVLIPAFAVGRAQTLMFALSELRKNKRIPEFPMYINSPMTTATSNVMKKHLSLHKLSAEDCDDIDRIFTFVRDVEASKKLNEQAGPMLIISASGMCTGGRILHHLKTFSPFAQNTILLTGFQAAGTRGEALLNGAEEIKIHGEYIPVRAQVENLDNVSAHADFKEILHWFAESKIKPRQVFVVHGEPSASDELRRRLSDTLGWFCTVPEAGDKVILEI